MSNIGQALTIYKIVKKLHAKVMDLSDIKHVIIALLIGVVVGCGEQSTDELIPEQYVDLPKPKLGIADKEKFPSQHHLEQLSLWI